MSEFDSVPGSGRRTIPSTIGILMQHFAALLLLLELTAGQAAPSSTNLATDTFYDPQQVQTIQLLVRDPDLQRMQAALPERIYVPATFRWGQQTIENVGVRYKGNSSSQPHQQHKRSFLIKFNAFAKGKHFLGLKRVALDNGVQFGSLFSEPLITEILRDLKIPAARCNFARLFLNGTFQGVYVNVERIDQAFLKYHFNDPSGALYKVDEGGPGCTLSPAPHQSSTRQRQRHAFEPKSKSARRHARDVFTLISHINHTPAADFSDTLHQHLHVDAFLKTMAVMLLAGAFDQLTGWNPHNYYLYHHPSDQRWHYLPWDLDVGFADNAFRRIPVLAGWNAAWPVPGGPPRPLIMRIVKNPTLLARYRQLANHILEQHFHPQVLLPRVNRLYEQIKDHLARDPFPHRRATNPEDRDYGTIVASIQDFIRRRYQTARSQLDTPGNPPDYVKQRLQPRRGPQPGKPSSDDPTELRLVSQSADRVTLQWNDNAEGEAGHILQRAEETQEDTFQNHIGQPGTHVTRISDTQIATGKTYRYRVFAVHESANGQRGTGVSNVVTVRIPAE